MLGSLSAAVKFSILILVGAVFLLAALALFTTIVKRAFSSSHVQIGKFIDLTDATKDQGPYLVARARELNRPLSLDGLLEIKVPVLATGSFAMREDFKFLADTKLTIQGVDVPGFITAIYNALPDDRDIVTGTPETVADGSAMRVEWKAVSGEQRSWLLRSSLANKSEANKQLIDQAIYRIVYHLYYDRDGPRLPNKSHQVNFPSPRQAYTWGPELIKPEFITNAIKEAEPALSYRPGSGTIFALLAQTYILQWVNDSTKRGEFEPKIAAAIAAAKKGDVTRIHADMVELQWLFYTWRYATDEPAANKIKGTLLAKLAQAIEDARDDRSWYARDLVATAKKLQKLDSANRTALRWPN